ncbi:MAG: hypothetical protein MZV64_17810 [Ignavibacteriales bacterium]|nr:hypothetical protein [Ignavibacteriales bacterium]
MENCGRVRMVDKADASKLTRPRGRADIPLKALIADVGDKQAIGDRPGIR